MANARGWKVLRNRVAVIEDSATNRFLAANDHVHNARRGAAVPQFRWSGGFPITANDALKRKQNARFDGSDHDVRSMIDGDGSFRVVAKREAGDPKNRRFFLQTSGIRQHNAGGSTSD